MTVYFFLHHLEERFFVVVEDFDYISCIAKLVQDGCYILSFNLHHPLIHGTCTMNYLAPGARGAAIAERVISELRAVHICPVD